MLLVDTNVLVDVLVDDPEWADWSIGQLRAQSKIHRLAINPIIYSELSLTFSTVEALDRTLDDRVVSPADSAMFGTPRIPACFVAHPRHSTGYGCGSLRVSRARCAPRHPRQSA